MDEVWVGRWISLKTPGAFQHRLSYFISLVVMDVETLFLAEPLRVSRFFKIFPRNPSLRNISALNCLGKARHFSLFRFRQSPATPKPIRGLDMFCLPLNGHGLHPKSKRGASCAARR
jgi:hypothetical protein